MRRIEEHIGRNGISNFTCSLHGGEPLLFGLRRMRGLLEKLSAVGDRQNCRIQFALTTNAVLITADWVQLLRDFNVSVAVSIDGPPEIHDKRRLTVRGDASWRETVSGYFDLCRGGLSPAILAVCDPVADPGEVYDHFAYDLGATFCDILVPDANNDDKVESIAPFYIKLFDHWHDRAVGSKCEVRILTEMVRGLVGLETKIDTIGFAPTQTVCVSTDGQLEAHDVLRIAGEARSRTQCNVFTHRLEDILADDLWCGIRDQSTQLSEFCLRCRYKRSCGGGQLAQRWSSERSYDNPSVYCSDYLAILDHIALRLRSDLRFENHNGWAANTEMQLAV